MQLTFNFLIDVLCSGSSLQVFWNVNYVQVEKNVTLTRSCGSGTRPMCSECVVQLTITIEVAWIFWYPPLLWPFTLLRPRRAGTRDCVLLERHAIDRALWCTLKLTLLFTKFCEEFWAFSCWISFKCCIKSFILCENSENFVLGF